MKKIYYLLIAIVCIVGFVIIKKVKTARQDSTPIYYTAEKGKLEFFVYATGNLEAEQSTNVNAPGSVFGRNTRIYEIAITDIVAEGTVVDSGEFIASLDQNLIQENITSAEDELELAYNAYEDAKMDSNLTLNNSRDAIVTAEEAVEEALLILAESKYESPATIRKNEMDKDKAIRQLKQSKQSYNLQKRKSATQVQQKEIDYERKKKRVKTLKQIQKDIYITAPQKGMVIYYTRWGEKRSIGSMVSSYSPTIATLPDMSSMISVAYVNEIDISKVKLDQEVELSIDAFPDKVLKGKVVFIANIGKFVSGSDAKVFEVKIKILSEDQDLRPAMTTNNTIHTATCEDTIIVPTEIIFSNDTMSYVINVNKKPYKQVVRVGEQNDNYTIIEEGIQEGDKLMWISPENVNDLPFKGIEIHEKEKREKLEEERKAEEEAERIEKEKKDIDYSDNGDQGESNIIIF